MKKKSLRFLTFVCSLLFLLPGCNSAKKPETPTNALQGKRILFIGDSFLVAGKTLDNNKGMTEQQRTGDAGYFYQLCKANGVDINIVNWVHTSTSLSTIQTMFLSPLKNRNFDYVVLSGGRNSASSYAALSETLDRYIAIFREANPNVKLYYLVTSGAHNVSVNESFPIDILNNLDAIEEKGITIVDWGKPIADIIRGKVSVPGGTQSYDAYTFVKHQSDTDGFHPNQLSGYFSALMTYCAITGESAVGQPYAFWNDTSLNAGFDPDKIIASAYSCGPTNYPDVFASEADMKGLQQLIDQYLAAKDYRNYNFTQADAKG
jgi:hypothetical protein